MDELINYLKSLHERPDAKIGLHKLHEAFLATLSPRQQKLWPKWRFVEEIEQRYVVGRDSRGTLCVAGIAFEPASSYQLVGDRLQLVTSN
jgi:hypothetical protein